MRQFCTVLLLMWNFFQLLVPLFSMQVNSTCYHRPNMTVRGTHDIQTGERQVSCDCGWRRPVQTQNRIVSGQEVGVNEFPAMALIWAKKYKENRGGATIISERYALTAAHVMDGVNLSEVELVVGEHNHSTTTETPYTVAHTIMQSVPHPNYNPQAADTYCDIAILKTSTPIQFNEFVGPICLPFCKYTTYDEASVIALGWGSLEFLSLRIPDSLQKADLKIINNTECERRRNHEKIIESQICTYDDVKDVCDGDSGGPILYQDSDVQRLYLIGVISYGQGCSTMKPGVNTRVTSFLEWIVNNTQDTIYCIK